MSKQKIIFLDVDGVLTYANYRNNQTAGIDIEKVKLLQQICIETNAKVVISSSWKGHNDYKPRIYYILIDILTKHNIEVIGNTPNINLKYNEDISSHPASFTLEDIPHYTIKHGTGRAAEIEWWIKNNDIHSFVIFDDEDWDWADYGYKNNWIQTFYYENGGLQPSHVNEAIHILNH